MDPQDHDQLFLQLPERERQEWASHPVTRLFLAHLLTRRQQQVDRALFLAAQADRRAAGYAGAQTVLGELYADCTTPREPAPASTADTTFVDPRRRKGS